MTNNEFVEKAKMTAGLKTLYVAGGFGQPLTAWGKNYCINQYTYNKNRSDMINAADENTFAFDCICLIKGILWGFNGDNTKKFGGAVYCSNGVPDITVGAMFGNCTNISKDFTNIPLGAMLYMSGHCGIYIGDGFAVESTPGWLNGVQVTAVGNIGQKDGYNTRTWTKWGKLPYITYEEEPAKDEAIELVKNIYNQCKEFLTKKGEI